MESAKLIALFILIQLASAVLTVIGIPLCAILAYGKFYSYSPNRDTYSFPAWAWLWDNEEDGALPYWYALAFKFRSRAHAMFMWSALRNPCNNLRYVRGVSAVGRPLWRKTFVIASKHFYVQAGWNGSGFPVLSGGANIYTD